MKLYVSHSLYFNLLRETHKDRLHEILGFPRTTNYSKV